MFLLSKIIYVIANRTNSARFLPSDFYLKIAYETLIGKKLKEASGFMDKAEVEELLK